MSLIAFNINNQSHKNHTNAPHHAAGRSPLSTQGHAFILTFFILQTSHLSKGTARRAEPLGEIQIYSYQ